MKNILSPETTQKSLTNEIIKSHNHLGYSAVDWFQWLIDDCLAGFGLKLKTLWTDEQTKHLFQLGRFYAEAVIKNPYKDVLGNLYQELSSSYGKKMLGQYFSPSPICECIAQISFNSEEVENKKIVRVSEPAAGSGVMVLAFIKTVADQNPALLEKFSFTCIDLDIICVKMTTLQIMANNLMHPAKIGELICLHGNTLGDPKNLSNFYHVSTPDFAAWAKEDEERPTIEVAQEEEKEIEIIFPTPKKQLSITDFLA